MRAFLVAVLAMLLSPGVTLAQQVADMDADLSVTRPAYGRELGPVIGIDAAHNNFHTADGRYAPFARVVANDGYRITSVTGPATAETLKPLRILVVANALAAENVNKWRLPTPSAFTDAEIHAVRNWVEGGGSLFLLVDHMPFPGAMGALARAFGFEFDNSLAVPPTPGLERFSRADGSLADSVIARGKDADTAVTKVRTFAGSSFRAPAGAIPLMTLGPGWTLVFPEDYPKVTPTTPKRPATAADLRGAALTFGKGRVVVVSEAAAFTAQSTPKAKVGFGADGAAQNKQLLLNILHWLSEP